MECENVKIVPFDRADPTVWNRLVDESSEAWLYNRTEWVRLEASIYQNESFMVLSDDEQPLGVFVVYLSSRGPRRFGDRFLFTGRNGPAMVEGLGSRQRRAVMDFSLSYLKERAQIYRANRLEVHLPPLAPAYLPPLRSEVNPLLEYGFNALPMYGSTTGIKRLQGIHTPTRIVELQTGDEEHLFAACSHACRNVVRKAVRAGVTCVQDTGPAGLEAFYIAYEASYRRSGSEMKSFAFFQKMLESLAEKGRINIFLSTHQGKNVASAVLLCYKNAVTYYAGGLDYEAHHLSPHNLLLWETLKWARREGCRWFEMGPYFPYLPEDSKMARIGSFKCEFGGSSFLLFEGVLLYSWPTYVAGALLEEAKGWLHSRTRRFVHYVQRGERQ